QQQPQNAKLIVRVVDANTNQPVPGAEVHVKAIGGQAHGPVPTDAGGLTGTFTLPATTAQEVHMVYRLSVRKAGYAEKWEDLPNEYAQPSLQPRTYPVQLTPTGAEHWTAAEQAAFARYRAWAAGKGGVEDPPMFGTAPTGRFTWKEPYRTPDGRIISITFATRCTHQPNHPAGPPPVPNYDEAIGGREDLAKVTIGGHPGMGSARAYHGAHFSWRQGWFDASLAVNSPWITHPELGEVKRWAEQMAGVIGDPGQ
ncbi:MAG: carboxypeptidase-like regulatory domain-containing protein, partial [Armatimonadetes bacterium]|nr:carboxypeptidase-like regulatory domain-containing protein [Armatimonadota bacterium]